MLEKTVRGFSESYSAFYREALDYQITFKLILLGALFFLSGFFSCSEAALFSLTPLHLHKMAEDRYPFLSYVRRLLNHPRKLLITIIVGNETANTTISVLVASLFLYHFPDKGQWLAIGVTVPVILVFAEALPKTFAVIYPMSISSLFSPVMMFFSRAEQPIVWIMEKIFSRMITMISRDVAAESHSLTEDEFRALIDAGEREGVLEEVQRDLIHAVFDLEDKPVSEIMVPRVDMFCLPVSLSVAEMEPEIIAARHSRIPVYGADRDDILGILFAKDLSGVTSGRERAGRAEKLLRKPHFVPEGKSVGSLFRDFQARKLQIAIVVDEYGGVSGLVTIEDILEDLFDDLYARHGIRDNLWQRIDERTLLVSGSMPMEDFRSLIDADIPRDGFDTVGGFVFHLFGKLPAKGESVSFNGYVFRIDMMGKARILTIRVEKREEDDVE